MDATLSPFDRISRACFRSFTALPGAEVIDSRETFGVVTDVPLTFFNGIASSIFEDGSALSKVERTIAAFTGRRTPFRWWITPDTRPEDLRSLLSSGGMRHGYDCSGMTADLARGLPEPRGSSSALRIEPIVDAHSITGWTAVVIEAFGLPPSELPIRAAAHARLAAADPAQWIHFAGFLDGEIVATSAVLLAGELAGVYQVATRPSMRGRGFGDELTRAALGRARESGAREAVLQASPSGARIYRRLGFVHRAPLTMYAWRPEKETP